MDVDQYLNDAETFNRAVSTERYRAGAGLQAGLNISPIYQKYEYLFEGELFTKVPSWELEPTQVRFLQEFIADGFLGSQTRELTEKHASEESAAAIEWDERPVPYRNVPVLLANEADAVRRHAL